MPSNFVRAFALLLLLAAVSSCDSAPTATPAGTFTISSDGFPAIAAVGGGAVGTVVLNRIDGHSSAITLTATGAPAGVTVTFAAAAAGATATAATFNVAGTVAPGSYPINITGTASGHADQMTGVTLNVIAAPATASFSMPFCASAVPVWFAYQNTGYLWQPVTPVNGVFTFPATATLAVAYTYSVNNVQVQETNLNILYAARTDLAGKESRDCAGPKSLTGTVSGAAAAQSIRVAMGAAFATPTAANPTFSLTGVADRALDLVATKGTITNTQSNLQLTPDLLLIQRNLNPATNTSVGTLDFAGQGFAPLSTNLTIANLSGGDQMNVGSTMWSSTNTYGVVHSFQPSTTSSTLYSVPAAQLQAGDLQELLVETFQSGFSFGRLNIGYFGGALSDRTETLAPNLATPTASTASRGKYVRLRGDLTAQPEYPSAVRFIFFQAGGSSADRLVYVVKTVGFLGATPATVWTATIPEFGTVTGLNTDWLPSTSSVVYQAEAYSAPGPVMFGGIPVAGDVVKIAYRVETNGPLAPAFRASLRREVETRQYLRR